MKVRMISFLFKVMILMFGSVGAAQADNGFSEDTIVGTWAINGPGFFISSAPPPFTGGAPANGIARFVFNEDGTCDAQFITNFDGTVVVSTPIISCNFFVTPDGFGQFTAFNSSPLSPFTVNFIIVNKDEIFGILEGTTIAQFTFKRQDSGDDDDDDD